MDKSDYESLKSHIDSIVNTTKELVWSVDLMNDMIGKLGDKADTNKSDMADLFKAHEGTKEYTGIVETIQRWYYGRLVKAAWCATSLSYFAEKAGVADQTGKHENVDRMKDYMRSRDMLDCTKNYGGGHYKPKKGDVVFMSSKHTFADCTHVGVVSSVNNTSGDLWVISGNCDDAIKTKHYNYLTDKYIVAFGRIKY